MENNEVIYLTEKEYNEFITKMESGETTNPLLDKAMDDCRRSIISVGEDGSVVLAWNRND